MLRELLALHEGRRTPDELVAAASGSKFSTTPAVINPYVAFVQYLDGEVDTASQILEELILGYRSTPFAYALGAVVAVWTRTELSEACLDTLANVEDDERLHSLGPDTHPESLDLPHLAPVKQQTVSDLTLS